MILHSQGYVSGGKDGAVCLWNDTFLNRLKTYHLQSDALEGGARLTFDLPAVRALCLGEGKILVGTKNSEVSYMCTCLEYTANLHMWL